MFTNTLADALARFEAARAMLGHACLAQPPEIAEIEESVPWWLEGPARTAWVLSHLADLWEKRRRQAFAQIPVPPALPEVYPPGTGPDGAILAHTTMTGRTRLVVRPSNVVGAEGQWRVTMERDVPIPLHDARRLAVAVLCDDIDALDRVDLEVDVIPPRHQAARRDDWGERVGDALTQLGWLGVDDRAPLWAVGMAGEALERYAPVPCPGRDEKRFAAILQELAELDEQLGDTQEDQSPEWSRRNRLVREALLVGAQVGIGGGWSLDPAGPKYQTVVYLELPLAGPRQVSWHVPDKIPTWWPYYGEDWDGHTMAEKRARIRAYLAARAATV